jgi:AraC-like DNA-binding protein
MVLETCEIGGDSSEEEVKNNQDRLDLKPEYCHYRDEGCEYAKECLNCPFPQCLFDEPRGRQRWMKQTRDREIKRLFNTGKKVKELAMLFGVSPRTIQRALRT